VTERSRPHLTSKTLDKSSSRRRRRRCSASRSCIATHLHSNTRTCEGEQAPANSTSKRATLVSDLAHILRIAVCKCTSCVKGVLKSATHHRRSGANAGEARTCPCTDARHCHRHTPSQAYDDAERRTVLQADVRTSHVQNTLDAAQPVIPLCALNKAATAPSSPWHISKACTHCQC
jgi:hypothetical protein